MDPPEAGRATLQEGVMVGEYQVTRLIGAGGMGVVYAGVHPLLDRPVAIKVISDEAAQTDEAAERFLLEARAASSLRHRNIVDVFAFGRLTDGRHYQVMELLEGQALRQVIDARAPLPLPLAAAMVRGILAALRAAERRGIVHRDIKPENVFVSGDLDGPPDELEVKVLDFGLAKVVSGAAGPGSIVGMPVGTPAYMSPEQCRAVEAVDARTDLYSVAVVFYELLTRAVPFRAPSAVEIMSLQLKASPPAPSTMASVPPAVEAVILRGLAKRPDDRFASAAEMQAAVDAAIAGTAPRPAPAPLARSSSDSPAFNAMPGGDGERSSGGDLPRLLGYRFEEKVHDGARNVLFRATRLADGQAMMVKRPREEYPDSAVLARYRREYELSRQVGAPFAVPAEVSATHRSRPYLVFERFEGQPLGTLLRDRLAVGEALSVMVFLARAVGSVHEAGVVHGGLSMDNVLVDFSDRAVRALRLVDFAAATRRDRHAADAVDHRADFRALGALLFELLVGSPPPAEGEPRFPDRLRFQVPGPVMSVAIKLLAGDADERYQSAGGLLRDLERCRKEFEATGAVARFELGQDDATDRLAIPRRLYGRDRELGILRTALERAAAGTRSAVLLSGPSGIGKSALMYELRAAHGLPAGRCLYAAGTCDRQERNLPYAPFVQILRALAPAMAEDVPRWRRAFEEALGPLARLLCDLASELEPIIGALPPLPPLEPLESQIRIHDTVTRALRLFARPGQPLLLFLDDLQWIDSADLALLQAILLDPGLQHLLFVGAHRDSDRLSPVLDKVDRGDVGVEHLPLAAFGEGDVAALVSDALQRRHPEVGPLARLLLQRTGGNPLFVRQYLEHLHRQGLIWFLHGVGTWTFDTARIEETAVTDSIAELLRVKILNTPTTTQELLQAAACIGPRFEVATLALLTGKDGAALTRHLRIALDEGIIRGDERRGSYAFSHERVHRAAYDLMPEGKRRRVHLDLARALLPGHPTDDRLLEVVTHLDEGWDLVESAEERRTGLELNMAAARVAKLKAAHDVALRYLRHVVDHLPDDAWESDYPLTRDLALDRAECEYLAGRRDVAEEIIAAALDHLVDPVERAAAYAISIGIKTNKGRPAEAIRVGVEALAMLGVELRAAPPLQQVAAAILEARRWVEAVPPERLVDRPLITDPRTLAILRIINRVAAPAYFADPGLYTLLHCFVLRLSLEHGHAPESVRGYSVFGMIVSSEFRLYSDGARFGELAIQLSDRLGNAHMKGVSRMLHGCFIGHWSRPLDESLVRLAEAHQYLRDSGDVVLDSFALCFHAVTLWVKGESLARVGEVAQDYLRYLRHVRYRDMVTFMECLQRVVVCLSGGSDGPLTLDGGGFREEQALASLRGYSIKVPLHWFLVARMELYFLYGELDAAARLVEPSREMMPGSRGAIYTAERVFFATLVALGRGQGGGAVDEARWTMALWASSAPENFLAKHLLVEAEAARLDGARSGERATDLYARALEAAREQQNPKLEAMVAELGGRYLLERDRRAEARAYLRHAQYAYALWGAAPKARQLLERHRDLLASP
jgi:predicted ATPase/serine/threonine protein kinase